jgi:ubiquinone/menaquinone biosynthesis C-methylase UbiE
MLDFITYDFGYSWSVRYAMIAPLIVAGSLAALAAWRSWPRWVFILATLMALWAAAAVVVLNVMLNSPMPLPTERFLRAGAGRVLDVGAGSGRAAVGVLIARPHVTATGVDIYSGYWGIDGNTPERFMANARIAGVADRAAARVGDMRQLPFGDGEFDAVVSSYAIDHLPRAERPKAIAEVARVLKPGGEFLLMIIRVDWRTWLVSPLLAHHPSQNPEPWRELLQQHGFSVEEEGTPFTTLYFLARKHGATRTHGSTTRRQNLTRAEPSNRTDRVRVLPATRTSTRRDGGPIIRDLGASDKSRVRANSAPADAVVHVDVVVGDRQSARRPSRGDIRVARAAGR